MDKLDIKNLMKKTLEIKTSIDGVHREDIFLEESFMDFAGRFASMPGTVLLMSGGKLDCARYHILGIMPWLSLKGRHQDLSVRVEKETFLLNADPFEALRNILDTFSMEDTSNSAPITAGLMGYLAYDLKDRLEVLPRTSMDDLGLPHICLFAPSIIIVHDKWEAKTSLYLLKRVSEEGNNLERDLKVFRKIMVPGRKKDKGFILGHEGFQSNFEKNNYLKTIEKIREYIASGHVYQVNMSQRFETDFKGNTFDFFRSLYKKNPAPFFAYINAEGHEIVSTSPERFLMRDGSSVEARPIKGTRPRGRTPEEDEVFREELKGSKKDDAELSMIVDLLRNDIGKVCRGGTVRVAEHKRLEAYRNVYHLVSIVEGKLAVDKGSVDLLEATFPGGSITGCPKIRSMEIIDELETKRRHVYTGAIGYFSFHNRMDLSIAIRTATIINNKMVFSVGGGIVYDSDPIEEYDETLHKGRTLMEVYKGRDENRAKKNYIWIDGAIKPAHTAFVPVTNLGFQYGFGFFETVRVRKGDPIYLEEHMNRFDSAWKELFEIEAPDLTWDEIIRLVIDENGLQDEIAAVKIMASWGSREEPPFDYHIIVTARRYIHRLSSKKEQGLKLAVYPEPRLSPLASHKTMNYLYYFLAGKWAKGQGADEALILNPDGTVSETNTANILCVKDKKIIRPLSPHVLPGVMEGKACDQLVKWGYEVEDRAISPDDLFSFDEIFLTNSLMGSVPVLQVSDNKMKEPAEICQKINGEIL